MNRKFSISLNEYYHIYNRGVEKREIFIEATDRKRFQRALFFLNNTVPVEWRDIRDVPYEESKKDSLTAIGAYCLMPNHFHILIKETREGGISKFMGKLTTSYSKYFNTKYDRVGPLFQGRFKAEHVDSDEHLKYLFAYIHLNPIKLIEPMWKDKGIKNTNNSKLYLEKYWYSSYLDYVGGMRKEELILHKEVFPEYFDSERSFQDFINDWLAFTEVTEARLP